MSDVAITVRDSGNLKVVGPVTLLDGAGSAIAIPEGKAAFLCRCGQSKTKPLCDSSHREVGFASVVRAAEVNAR
jgi:CDGSH iron-sulfur domain-containing protein 3